MGDQETQPHSELASFGEELRREREIRGISLKEISDATKISKRFLEAIERNDHRTLPAPVFTRGFVREYARYLGLNAEEMVNRYNYAAAGDDRIEKSAHLERLVTPQPTPMPNVRKKGIPPPYARIDRNIYITILIIILLAAVGWWAFRYKRQRAMEMVEAAAHPAAATAAPVPKAATPAPAPAQTATQPPATNPNPDLLRLTINLNDDSWITLLADGKTVVSDELKRGDTRTFEAKDEFRFKTVGNAGGVALTVNGIDVPSLGRDRQVIHDRIFDRHWLQQHAHP
jgi:cytoskeleton protein RodZ